MLCVKYADLRNYPDPFTSISREFRDFERIYLNFPRVQEKSDTKKVHKFRILCFYSYVLLYSNWIHFTSTSILHWIYLQIAFAIVVIDLTHCHLVEGISMLARTASLKLSAWFFKLVKNTLKGKTSS